MKSAGILPVAGKRRNRWGGVADTPASDAEAGHACADAAGGVGPASHVARNRGRTSTRKCQFGREPLKPCHGTHMMLSTTSRPAQKVHFDVRRLVDELTEKVAGC